MTSPNILHIDAILSGCLIQIPVQRLPKYFTVAKFGYSKKFRRLPSTPYFFIQKIKPLCQNLYKPIETSRTFSLYRLLDFNENFINSCRINSNFATHESPAMKPD